MQNHGIIATKALNENEPKKVSVDAISRKIGWEKKKEGQPDKRRCQQVSNLAAGLVKNKLLIKTT